MREPFRVLMRRSVVPLSYRSLLAMLLTALTRAPEDMWRTISIAPVCQPTVLPKLYLDLPVLINTLKMLACWKMAPPSWAGWMPHTTFANILNAYLHIDDFAHAMSNTNGFQIDSIDVLYRLRILTGLTEASLPFWEDNENLQAHLLNHIHRILGAEVAIPLFRGNR